MKINERMYQSVIGVLAIIIIFLVWWIASHPGAAARGIMATSTDMTDTSAMTDESSTSPAPVVSTTVQASGETVVVAGQAAGMSINVSSVTLSQPGWVAVRDTSGRTLGAAWFDAGTHSSVSVPLLRATAAGDKYQVLLYADNGDHQFDLHTDTLITNSDGSVPGTTFSAQ